MTRLNYLPSNRNLDLTLDLSSSCQCRLRHIICHMLLYLGVWYRSELINFTELCPPSYKFWMMVMISYGIPYFFRIHQSDGQWTLSNAFLMSMKFFITGLFHAVIFSITIIYRRINIWSLQDLPCLNPACSWHSWLLIAFLILPSRTLLKTLLVLTIG